MEARGFLYPYAYGGELTCRTILDAGYCSRVLPVLVAVFVQYACSVTVSHRLAVLVPASLSSRSRSCLVACIRVVIYPHP